MDNLTQIAPVLPAPRTALSTEMAWRLLDAAVLLGVALAPVSTPTVIPG
jgi:hypothetical protein